MSDQHPELLATSQKTLPREARASTCGKAIIVGEHAAVYGCHAVAMPLKQLRMQIEVKPMLQACNHREFHLKIGGKEVSRRVTDVFADAFSLLRQPSFSLQAKGSSNFPIGAGLGSSASLCIAIVKVLLDSMQLQLSKTELARIGNQLEARFHGNPSGLDTSVVAFEECVYFAKDQPIQAISLEPEPCQPRWEFALIDSKVRASTMAMIRIAAPFFKAPQGDKRLAEFDQLAEIVKYALPALDTLSVAEAMNRCHQLLCEAGVVPDSLQAMIQECRDLGLPSSKITGAGGGGNILCLLDPTQADEQFVRLTEHFANYQVYRTSI